MKVNGKEIKIANKEYHRLLDKKSKLRNKYYDIVEESGCESCDYYNHGNVRNLSDRFSRCDQCDKLNKILKLCSEIESCNADIEGLLKSYAQIID